MDKVILKKKWTPNRFLIISLALIPLLMILIYFFRDKNRKIWVDKEKILISMVEMKDFSEYISVVGQIYPLKTIYIDAVEGGIVEEKFVEEGKEIKKGDKILKLSNTQLLLDIMFRESQLYEQINNLRNTRIQMEQHRIMLQNELLEIEYQLKGETKQLEINRQLIKNELISRQEFLDQEDRYALLKKRNELYMESWRQDSLFRKLQIDQLERSINYMEGNLNIARQNLDNLLIKAPMDGLLSSLKAEIGESKAVGYRIGQIDIIHQFKVRADIDEHYVSRVFPDQIGKCNIADSSYQLVVKTIYPEIKNGKFQVDLNFIHGYPAHIRRGQTLHIDLELSSQYRAVVIPKGGFYQKTGGNWIFVLNREQTQSRKKFIRIGKQNPQYFEILEGLTPGEFVITSDYELFGESEIIDFN